jgi:death-on-curing protein
MRYLSLSQVLQLHRRIIDQSGGRFGILDLGLLESVLRQPRMAFGGTELYPSLAEKASVLGFTIIHHRPFIDGNKRTGHAAMEIFLLLNGYELIAPMDESEKIVLHVASGELSRDEFKTWIEIRLSPLQKY